MVTMPMTGAILAGGKHGGEPWAMRVLTEVDGEALIDRQIRTMRELCREIIVVTDTPRPLLKALDASIRIITDYHTERGPLGGIHAALYLAKYEKIWIAACELPNLSAAAARKLWEHRTPAARAVIPIVRSQPIALHGIYDKSCAEAVNRQLMMNQTSLDAFLGRIEWQGVPADEWLADPDIGDFTRKLAGSARQGAKETGSGICHGLSTSGGHKR